MSETNWYYAANNERMGPVTEKDLASLVANGTIGPKTLVWRDGMADWTPAESALPENMLSFGSQAGGTAPPLTQPYVDNSYHPTDFQAAVKTCLNNYATFTGRARRPEYWYFALFSFGGNVVLSIVDAMVFGFGNSFAPLSTIFALAVLVPSLAAGARRLHDIDRSGWWLLIALIPLIGFIVLIIFLAKKGDQGDNRYGPA